MTASVDLPAGAPVALIAAALGLSPERVTWRPREDGAGTLEADATQADLDAAVLAGPGLATQAAWLAMRAERDRRLAATDFRVLADAPWDLAPWLAYRQALRDMPETTTDPLAPSWPTEPT